MTPDRRLFLANDRVVHVGLRETIAAPHYAETTPAEVAYPIVDLLRTPQGPRERQLLLGDGFDVLERHLGFAYGRAKRDGYCGYLPEAAICAPTGVSHWVASPASHLYSDPSIKAANTIPISFGTRLRVLGQSGSFAQTPQGYVPVGHLQPLGTWYSDPVEVAGLFLGTPYLWGGNSHTGLDCSGLVQMASLACGQPCPGDSDLQQGLGQAVPAGEPPTRGDLLFWKGHVAMMVDTDLMIHANAHFMATVIEPAADAIPRIAAQGGGDVTARRRVTASG